MLVRRGFLSTRISAWQYIIHYKFVERMNKINEWMNE